MLTGLFVVTQACNTTGTEDDHGHDHDDPYGYIVTLGDDEIVRSMGDELLIAEDFTSESVEGLVLSPSVVNLDGAGTGEEPDGTTRLLRIRWIGADGEPFDLPDDDDHGGYSIEWGWEKPNLPDNEMTCTGEVRANPDYQDEIRPANLEMEGQWQFRFRADHAGSDRLQIRLMHGHDDHAHLHFVSRWLPIEVAFVDHPMVEESTGIYNHEGNRCRTE